MCVGSAIDLPVHMYAKVAPSKVCTLTIKSHNVSNIEARPRSAMGRAPDS